MARAKDAAVPTVSLAEQESGTADATVTPVVRKKPKAKLVFGGIAILLATGATVVWAMGRGKESTDDAFVEGHVATVAARIQGQVVKVAVKDNQLVEVGQVLVQIDDRDAKVRMVTAEADLMSAKANLSAMETQLALTEKTVEANLRQAKGGLTTASAMIGSSKAGIDQAKADVDAAESRRALAELDLKRAEKLKADGAIAQAELDTRKAGYDQAVANVAQARAREQNAQVGTTSAAGSAESAQGRLVAAQAGPEQIEAARAAVAVAKARVAQSEAALDQAKLNLSYTEVKAQVRGVVSRRSVEVGQTVDPSRPLMAISALDDLWVVANYKEDQIADIKEGESASVKIDAFPGRVFKGHVDSVQAGSGARFSLLPPDNASGNFTKVVQRVPVLVRIDDKPADIALRPGLSTYVTITTGH
ncbi:MAG: Membrane fusion component of tripartite multidrug resistance system [Labilithrix sp.]|nr:Membrane fusion component of tripartite multidrug resistance system [Labilithrix sp.]